MGAQSRCTSIVTGPFDVSRFTWKTSGAVSGRAGALAAFLGGSGEEQPVSATKTNAAASALGIALQYAMVKLEMMAAYDDFAWFYNRYWADEFHKVAIPVLERIWLPRVPAGGRLLDVCCGTGYLAGNLGRRGFQV